MYHSLGFNFTFDQFYLRISDDNPLYPIVGGNFNAAMITLLTINPGLHNRAEFVIPVVNDLRFIGKNHN